MEKQEREKRMAVWEEERDEDKERQGTLMLAGGISRPRFQTLLCLPLIIGWEGGAASREGRYPRMNFPSRMGGPSGQAVILNQA